MTARVRKLASAQALGLVVALGGIVACAITSTKPAAPGPANACPTFDCAAYVGQTPAPTCQAGACETSAQIDYVLVVNVPQTSLFAPGQVFAIRSADLFSRTTPNCKGRNCTVLPPLGSLDGNYLVNPAGATVVGRVLSNPAAVTSLPIQVTMRPLWSPLPSDAPADAADIGIPLDTVFGATRVPTYPDPPKGPGGASSVEFHVSVPAGRYERTVAPTPPFDDAFPPDIREVVVPAPRYDQVLLVTDTSSIVEFPTPLSREGGDLEGFTVTLVDAVTGRRASTSRTLTATDTSATLRVHRATGDVTRLLDLRLAPPLADADVLPVLSYAFVAGNPVTLRYPELPHPVVVEGTVGSDTADGGSGVPVAASIELESYEIETTAEIDKNLKLQLVRRIVTDAAGHYSVRLPPGRYHASIRPVDTSTTTPAVGVAPPRIAMSPTEDIRIASSPLIQRGRFLTLKPTARVRGRCRITDGRALAGALVVARPAALLSQPPTTVGAVATSPAAFPREASVTTDADGAFELGLDPGLFDLTVKPAPGSRLPWIVLASRFVGTDAVDLGTLSVPAPIAAGLTVRDGNDNRIFGAVVRAFAVPTGGAVAVEIGAGLTDAQGAFEMDLAGYPR